RTARYGKIIIHEGHEGTRRRQRPEERQRRGADVACSPSVSSSGLCLLRVPSCPSWIMLLRQQLLDDPRRLDAGEAHVEALVADGEALVVEAEQVQHGGVEVADV